MRLRMRSSLSSKSLREHSKRILMLSIDSISDWIRSEGSIRMSSIGVAILFGMLSSFLIEEGDSHVSPQLLSLLQEAKGA